MIINLLCRIHDESLPEGLDQFSNSNSTTNCDEDTGNESGVVSEENSDEDEEFYCENESDDDEDDGDDDEEMFKADLSASGSEKVRPRFRFYFFVDSKREREPAKLSFYLLVGKFCRE